MAETLSIVSIVAFVVAGVCFAIALILFFTFNIPSVIGDLSGRTAKKSIKKMRITNENSGNKEYRTSENNKSRGKLTATMRHDSPKSKGKQEVKVESPSVTFTETGLLKESMRQTYSESTVLLSNTEGNDAVNDAAVRRVDESKKKAFSMIDDVVMIHTDEVI